MKIALASVIKNSASAAPERNRIKNTSAVLRKLSLNAAKNWHQNSGAKRLDNIRGGGIAAIIAKFQRRVAPDRKSTRLNSSHANISYAVFCLKKKQTTSHPLTAKQTQTQQIQQTPATSRT